MKTTPPPTALLTARKAAPLLGLDHSMVCRYCRQGRIKAIRPGSEWLISQEELDRFASVPRPMGNPMFRDRAKRRRRGAGR